MKRKIFIMILLFSCFFLQHGRVFGSSIPEVQSQAAILINPDSGKILYEKNAYERMYPASTTKIMTAILVLESGLPLRRACNS